MNIHSFRNAITKNYVRLSLFEQIEGIPRKIEFPKALSGRSSVVISPGGEEWCHSQRKNYEILFHTINLLPKEERLKRTNILVFLLSFLQRILKFFDNGGDWLRWSMRIVLWHVQDSGYLRNHPGNNTDANYGNVAYA